MAEAIKEMLQIWEMGNCVHILVSLERDVRVDNRNGTDGSRKVKTSMRGIDLKRRLAWTSTTYVNLKLAEDGAVGRRNASYHKRNELDDGMQATCYMTQARLWEYTAFEFFYQVLLRWCAY